MAHVLAAAVSLVREIVEKRKILAAGAWEESVIVIHPQADTSVRMGIIPCAIVPVMRSWIYSLSRAAVYGKVAFARLQP